MGCEGRVAMSRAGGVWRGLARALVAWLAWSVGLAAAHELQPGYLELKEGAPQVFAVTWKRPTLAGGRLPVVPVFPENCVELSPPKATRGEAFWATTTQIRCAGGLAGRALVLDGLEALGTDVLVRIEYARGGTETAVVRAARPQVDLAGANGTRDYLLLGLEHILTGFDHLVFVLGLLLIVSSTGMLVKTVTAFTAAHSITLALSTLGLANPPARPVEICIALSIFFLAPEIVRRWRGETSFTLRHPWLVAFAFGLLHGFGFAGALARLGLPRAEIPWALVSFNLGVEAGQLAFVALCLLLRMPLARLRARGIAPEQPLDRLPGYVVGSLGAYWLAQRIVA